MYERFFNLRERPFSLSPDPDYLYPSRIHTEALSYLRYGLEGHAGFIVLTGEVGSGKTTLLQTVLRGLDRQTSVSRIVNTLLEPRELIEAVLLDFGVEARANYGKPHLLRELARFLVAERQASRLALLVIDEAQNLSLNTLEEVRMLSNLETEKSKLLQIILVGQPSLRDTLGRPELQQLHQRIAVRYHLGALDAADTAAYLRHRLRRASIGTPIVEFPPPVSALVHRHSRGMPRTINLIADAILLFAYGESQPGIAATLAREAIGELEATGVIPTLHGSARAPANRTPPVVPPVLGSAARAVPHHPGIELGHAGPPARERPGTRPLLSDVPPASRPVQQRIVLPSRIPPGNTGKMPGIWARIRRALRHHQQAAFED